MSRSKDLVAIATGDLTVILETLSLSKRIRLFTAFVRVMQEHYNGVPGGANFISWQEENFGENLTRKSIRRHSLALDESLYPKSENYNKDTKIFALTDNYFRLPEFKQPRNGEWKVGETKLVTRLCLTQHGDIYLEWHLGRVSEMWVNHPNLPSRIVVSEARYVAVPQWYYPGETPNELRTLFEKDPSFLYSFGFSCLSLLKSEEEEKTRLAQRDAKAFAGFASIGKMFGITHP